MLKKKYSTMRSYSAALQSIKKLPLGFKNSPGITHYKKCGRVQRSASKNDVGSWQCELCREIQWTDSLVPQNSLV